MSTTASKLVVPPPEIHAQSHEGPPEKTSAQKYVHRTFLCGLAIGFLQMLLSGLALGVVLDLLRRGTLVTPGAILLPMSCLAVSALALMSMTGLRKHQRFRSWLPALCYLAGMGLCTALALLEKSHYLGEGGVRGFFLQHEAKLPVEDATGWMAPLNLAPLALAVTGALGTLPFLCVFCLYVHPGSRRLLKWMAMK